MINHITDWLIHRGYRPIDNETGGLLFRESDEKIYAVTLSYADKEDDSEDYIMIQRRVEFMLATRLKKTVECLHIVLTKDGMFDNIEYKLLEKLENVWLVANDTGRIYIFENQITEFDGLKNDLECMLFDFKKQKKSKLPLFRVAPVNVVLVVLNLLCYVVVIALNRNILAVYDSEIMLSMGAMSYETFMAGAWYQIVTSMFLHFGLEHLCNNMLLLAYAGYELEKRIGSIPYLLLYMGSGIVGNIASLVYYHGQGTQVVSAGASGAIYGVLGALVIILIVHQIRKPNLSPRRIIIMVLITIYHGFTSTGVDNAAHIGGLLTGIVVGFLLSKISQYGKLERVNFMR